MALQAVIGLSCGLLSAILSRSILMIISSIIVAPLAAVIVSFILSGFFYYTFLFFFKREVGFRVVYTHILFASIPVLLTNIAAPLIPFIGLLGVAAAAFLLYTGFVANAGVNEKKLRILLIGLVAIYTIMVAIQTIRFHEPDSRLGPRATPESIDILEQEMNLDE